jgi:hypothetical protein
MIRVIGDSLIYGPFYNGSTGGLMTPEVSASYADCNANFPCVDQASPILAQSKDLHKKNLILGSVWTWDEGEPSQNGTICVAIGTNGRWKAGDCTSSLPFACQSASDPNKWTVSVTTGIEKFCSH